MSPLQLCTASSCAKGDFGYQEEFIRGKGGWALGWAAQGRGGDPSPGGV